MLVSKFASQTKYDWNKKIKSRDQEMNYSTMLLAHNGTLRSAFWSNFIANYRIHSCIGSNWHAKNKNVSYSIPLIFVYTYIYWLGYLSRILITMYLYINVYVIQFIIKWCAWLFFYSANWRVGKPQILRNSRAWIQNSISPLRLSY